MGDFWEYGQVLWGALLSWGIPSLDLVLVLGLMYGILVLIGEQRTLWMVRGFILVLLLATLSDRLGLFLLAFVLEKLVIGSAVALALALQREFQWLLEQLGRGQWSALLTPPQREPLPETNDVVDEVVDAIKELSQNRVGALILMETTQPLQDRDVSVPGVRLNAEVSKELLQTLFQTTTLLHDGAVWIRGARVVSAGVILPLSERVASRQLGTRHRAAMGITERVGHCLCLVVSEETGSISLAEKGILNRPLTSSKLRELLRARLSTVTDRDPVTPQLLSLGKQVQYQGQRLLHGLTRLFSSVPPPRR